MYDININDIVTQVCSSILPEDPGRKNKRTDLLFKKIGYDGNSGEVRDWSTIRTVQS